MPLFLIFPHEPMSFNHALPLWHQNKLIFTSDRCTDSYFTVIKSIRGDQAVNTIAGALLIFVGAQRIIVGAHFSIVGA